jgi:hypothetical protein
MSNDDINQRAKGLIEAIRFLQSDIAVNPDLDDHIPSTFGVEPARHYKLVLGRLQIELEAIGEHSAHLWRVDGLADQINYYRDALEQALKDEKHA